MIALGTPPDPGSDSPTTDPDPSDGPDRGFDEPLRVGDGTADTSAVVRCPYCGEEVELALDPGGGSPQRYVEDCEVCCRPWRVTVTWDERGGAAAEVRTEDD
ncbi:MAG: CPXCG motif-containing cysteine-rich protein [Gammaproteobacteria bacterium]|nr:CPXCG motif-containing cysteine-rich protein [Gemmatimonadota bacterium]NIR38170.1 CPXCG motif-containing cysteine-rich protein [Actinomycetota bacterium]NIU76158.1 CPXCG motif-containing cysteine-rich protein [Gammaproteobacteria bacterium]NIY10017.1 CPXCG motif-containing cysteine-rich protein [Gemmatimonadota bacterium]